MDRRTKICIWVIMLGLANFLIYTILYMFIGASDAATTGYIKVSADGTTHYFLRGAQPPKDDSDEAPLPIEVSKGVYIYSGIHSISIWPTVGAVMLAMLTLAKDRIVSSMRSTIIRGRTFITILATIITMIVVVMTIWFSLQFARSFAPTQSSGGSDTPAAQTAPAS